MQIIIIKNDNFRMILKLIMVVLILLHLSASPIYARCFFSDTVFINFLNQSVCLRNGSQLLCNQNRIYKITLTQKDTFDFYQYRDSDFFFVGKLVASQKKTLHKQLLRQGDWYDYVKGLNIFYIDDKKLLERDHIKVRKKFSIIE